MIRVAGVRTGVEILGSETEGLYPPIQGQPADPAQLGALGLKLGPGGEVLNPWLWVHELTVNGAPAGQLVLCDPALAKLTATIPPAVQPYFSGLQPGEEHWRWSGPDVPPAFELRGNPWPAEVREPAVRVDRFVIGAFDAKGPGVPARDVPRDAWAITTDADPEPIGAVVMGPTIQRWFARPGFLVDGLIPPGSDGRWVFERAVPLGAADLVALELGPP